MMRRYMGLTFVNGSYIEDQKSQKMMVEELSINLEKTELIQVNNEILSAYRFAQKFKKIPDRNIK